MYLIGLFSGSRFFSFLGSLRAVVPSYYVTVKYLREVTPYFRKATILADIGWELPHGFLLNKDSLFTNNKNGSTMATRPDTKQIPLALCFLSRGLSHQDTEMRLIELWSPDAKHVCVLRCMDATEASAWFNALHSCVAQLMQRAIAQANQLLAELLDSNGIKHMAWMAQKVTGEKSGLQWKPVFGVVTEKDFLLYDAVPWTKDSWASPSLSYPLITTRLVHSSASRHGSAIFTSLNDIIVLSTRTGTRHGVEVHTFRVDTHRDLATWARTLVQGAHAAALAVKEITCPCTWSGQETELMIHYDNGFTLRDVVRLEDGHRTRIIWHYPFESLRMSADDGHRILWLDFGGDDGEQELDLHSCPKPVVFILHTFLSAKVNRLGLFA
uniref:PH domain-containing protein n=1 Tax=Strigamia maritima TaxID=126957 RepID=T1J2B7_STRMM